MDKSDIDLRVCDKVKLNKDQVCSIEFQRDNHCQWKI